MTTTTTTTTLCAKDLMATKLLTVSPEMSLGDLQRFLISKRIGGAPVVDKGKLVGLVSRSDVVRHLSVERAIAESLADYQRDLGSWRFQSSETEEQWIERTTAADLQGDCVRDVMIREVISVAPETPIDEIARRMLQHRIHRVLVTDDGELRGMLTTTDIMRLFADGRVTVADR